MKMKIKVLTDYMISETIIDLFTVFDLHDQNNQFIFAYLCDYAIISDSVSYQSARISGKFLPLNIRVFRINPEFDSYFVSGRI